MLSWWEDCMYVEQMAMGFVGSLTVNVLKDEINGLEFYVKMWTFLVFVKEVY